MTEAPEKVSNFIQDIITADLAVGKNGGRVHTRFPPEPNGYLHIGHAKSIVLNFSLAEDNGGKCNLRFDDTNPEKENVDYVESIQRDVKWLGYDWEDRLFFASDYYDRLYAWAIDLIKAGKAYVDSQSPEEMRARRGTLTEPGQNSPYRDRSVEENLDLFERMKSGEFDEGTHILRAKIDMASPNMNLRDPAVYRIRKAHHHRTGDKWCIYPMYDFAHGLSDAIEGITHSVCTLEFENHRPLYDWFLDNLEVPHRPRQIEFARLNLTYTVMSKRKLLSLIEEGHVSGWDDPRMMTVSGLRRRGFTPAAIRTFCKGIGVTKNKSWIDMGVLENAIRDDLNAHAPRAMAVIKPLKVVIENYPEDKEDVFNIANHPQDDSMGKREVPFTRELYIEQEDFMEDPPKKFFRLGPGREVRLRGAYFVTCTDVIKDDNGAITELRCTYDPATKGGAAPDGRKVKGTLHWVSAKHAVQAEVRVYDRLFNAEHPDEGTDDYHVHLNPDSLEVLSGCMLEPALANAQACDRFQFERLGYFCVDEKDSAPGKLVFNRTVTLRDSWAKAQQP